MPKSFKRAIVRPLIKKKGLDSNDLRNFRPVSGLPFISKIIERAVANQLTCHLNNNCGFDKMQSAYRRHFSCETCIVKVLDVVFTAMDSKLVTILTLLDLSSAFDTVDRDLLLMKLEAVGVTGSALQWFKTYLTDREQSVVINSTFSTSFPLQCGVPQGSVLGPLLFAIYLFGIGDVFSSHGVDYIIYADDIQF